MQDPIKGHLDAKGRKFALVVSRYHQPLTEQLLNGAMDCLLRHGAAEGDLSVVQVPGTFEIPLACQQLARAGRHDAIVCLGVLIRGETPHFDLIASEVSRGLSQTCLSTGVPVAFGIVTAESAEQAMARAGGKAGNRGVEAALAAIEMADLLRRLER